MRSIPLRISSDLLALENLGVNDVTATGRSLRPRGCLSQALGCLSYGHGSKSRLAPSEHQPIPTKMGSKMGGEFTCPKMVPLVLTHSHICLSQALSQPSLALSVRDTCLSQTLFTFTLATPCPHNHQWATPQSCLGHYLAFLGSVSLSMVKQQKGKQVNKHKTQTALISTAIGLDLWTSTFWIPFIFPFNQQKVEHFLLGDLHPSNEHCAKTMTLLRSPLAHFGGPGAARDAPDLVSVSFPRIRPFFPFLFFSFFPFFLFSFFAFLLFWLVPFVFH